MTQRWGQPWLSKMDKGSWELDKGSFMFFLKKYRCFSKPQKAQKKHKRAFNYSFVILLWLKLNLRQKLPTNNLLNRPILNLSLQPRNKIQIQKCPFFIRRFANTN